MSREVSTELEHSRTLERDHIDQAEAECHSIGSANMQNGRAFHRSKNYTLLT